MKEVKHRIINVLISACVAWLMAFCLHSGSSWAFQNSYFRLGIHNEVVKNVIQINDLNKNKTMEGKTLAFGNSQIRSVFLTHKNKKEADLNWFYLGAFRYGAWPYFKDQLINSQPDTILLFLSDKDFNYRVVFNSLFHHPISLKRYLTEISSIKKFTDHSDSELAQIGLSEVITPFKFSYQLKHLVKEKLFLIPTNPKQKKKKNRVKSDYQERKQGQGKKKVNKKKKKKNKAQLEREKYKDLDDLTYRGVKSLLRLRDLSLNPDRVEYNLSLFTEFLEEALANDIKIIFVEGQWHPRAMDHPNFKDEDPHKLINEIADKYEGISVMDINDQIKLKAKDYVDHIHFTKEGGKRLKESILKQLAIHNSN